MEGPQAHGGGPDAPGAPAPAVASSSSSSSPSHSLDAASAADLTIVEVRKLEARAAELESTHARGDLVRAFDARLAALSLELPRLGADERVRRKRQLVLQGNGYVVSLLASTPSAEGHARRTRQSVPPGSSAAAKQRTSSELQLLRRAEAVLTHAGGEFPKRLLWELEGVVCTNYACVYKRSGKNHFALDFALRALAAEKRLGSVAVGTHLSLCAIFSDMHRHNQAAQHGALAVKGARAYLAACANEPRADPPDGDAGAPGSGQRPGAPLQLLMAAYYSLAVQLEQLGRLPKALEYLELAREVGASLSLSPQALAQGEDPRLEDIEAAIAQLRERQKKNDKPRTPGHRVSVAPGTVGARGKQRPTAPRGKPGNRPNGTSRTRFRRVYASTVKHLA